MIIEVLKSLPLNFIQILEQKKFDSINKLDSPTSIAPDFAVSVLSGLRLDKRWRNACIKSRKHASKNLYKFLDEPICQFSCVSSKILHVQ